MILERNSVDWNREELLTFPLTAVSVDPTKFPRVSFTPPITEFTVPVTYLQSVLDYVEEGEQLTLDGSDIMKIDCCGKKEKEES